MWEWLLSPIDPARAHEVGFAISWHGRAMVFGWGILAPLAIIIARFCKIAPGQNWPKELDSKLWWRTHWMGQTTVLLLSFIGIALVMPPDWGEMSTHHRLGYAVLIGMVLQVALGLARGSKGGPTDRRLRGHHYDMTPWRLMFEALHKTLGYAVLALAAVTILFGLWQANAPVWMWLMLAVWWPLLALLFVSLQKRGLAVDTYQAIWGDDPAHPGNTRPAPGWGVRRPGDEWKEGGAHVRRDRGDRLRSH